MIADLKFSVSFLFVLNFLYLPFLYATDLPEEPVLLKLESPPIPKTTKIYKSKNGSFIENEFSALKEELVIFNLKAGEVQKIEIESTALISKESVPFPPLNPTELIFQYSERENILVNEQESSKQLDDTLLSRTLIDEVTCLESKEICEEKIPVKVEARFDLPVILNKKVKAFIKLYRTKKKKQLQKGIDRSYRYMEMIKGVFKEKGIPQDLKYLAIVESNFNPRARSKAGATGIWQFMYRTGRSYKLYQSWWHDDRMDPELSTHAAGNYLRDLYQKHKNWELALAAYNSGSGTVRKAIERNKKKGKPIDYWSLKLPRETRGYVPAFMAVAMIYSNPEKYGFKPHPKKGESEKLEWKYYNLKISGGVTLQNISKFTNIDLATLKKYNPAIKRGVIPITEKQFVLHIPVGSKVSEDMVHDINESKSEWKVHKIVKGDTLWKISRTYRIPQRQIKAFNPILKGRRYLRVGLKLIIPVPSDWKKPLNAEKVIKVATNYDGRMHKVIKGDTLWKISQLYQVKLKSLLSLNGFLAKRNILKIGVLLKIP